MKKSMFLSVLGLLATGQVAHLTAADSSSQPAPLPVLLVIANQDFYYREYSETRRSLELSGLTVKVAAATTSRCLPTGGSGQPIGLDGSVVPNLPVAKVDASDYSAIVFVGGWGSSMYQYAYSDPNFDGRIDSYYANSIYNGNGGEAKAAANELINDFVAQDKYVAGLCHGVTVLAWARVDGASPLQGKKVCATPGGSPATVYLSKSFANNELGVHEQVVANGAFSSPYSGLIGNPATTADDVVVDGKIITGENYTSAPYLGRVLATLILKSGT